MMDTSNIFNQPNSFNTPNKSTKEKDDRKAQSVAPVCIRQLRDFEGEEFAMFGMKAKIFNLVCILRGHEVSSTKAIYTVEDHTGEMKAILWLENDSSNELNLPAVKEGRYVRLFASLRSSEDERSLLILKMTPIENINEITNHLLEVIHYRYAAEKISKEDECMEKIVQNNPSAQLANTMTTMYETDVNHSGLTPIQLKVKLRLENEDHPNGVSRTVLLNMFPANLHKEVDKAIEFLSAEGHLYSTIDNQHFKSTT